MKKICLSFLSLALLGLTSNLYPFYTQVQYPSVEHHLYNLRDPKMSCPGFRVHMTRVGEHLGYAIGKAMFSIEYTIETPLKAVAMQKLLFDPVTVVGVLRGGVPLANGIMSSFAKSEGGFVACRQDEETQTTVCYLKMFPNLANKVVIVADAMIATGGTMEAVLKEVVAMRPKKIFVATAIATKKGLERIHEMFPEVAIFTVAVDPKVNSQGLIVPGMGDAGDRSYGVIEGKR
jgi:uracil phosphoribosyltransferase